MRGALFIVIILVVAVGAMMWWHMRQPAQVTNVVVEADKRKQMGASVAGYGFNFAW